MVNSRNPARQGHRYFLLSYLWLGIALVTLLGCVSRQILPFVVTDTNSIPEEESLVVGGLLVGSGKILAIPELFLSREDSSEVVHFRHAGDGRLYFFHFPQGHYRYVQFRLYWVYPTSYSDILLNISFTVPPGVPGVYIGTLHIFKNKATDTWFCRVLDEQSKALEALKRQHPDFKGTVSKILLVVEEQP